jgi:hypothetical protein
VKIPLLLVAAAFFSLGVYAQTPTAAGDGGPSTPSEKPVAAALTNEDILKLNEAGLGDDVIIAKINAAAQAAFRVDTDDLIGLKKAGVSQNIIAAMIKRSGAGSAAPAEGPSDKGAAIATAMSSMGMPGADDLLISLIAKDGITNLVSMEGHMATTWAVVTTLVFSDFPGTKADVRTKDLRPFITIRSSKSPQGRFFLVRCKSNEKDNDRSVKQGRAGMFSNKDFGTPDADWTVPVDVKAVQPGLWRMDPKRDLKPGEYGVFGGWVGAAELYDFGVDG